MLQTFIIRDGGATKIPRELADMAAVEKMRDEGFEIEVVGSDAAPDAQALPVATKAAAPAKRGTAKSQAGPAA